MAVSVIQALSTNSTSITISSAAANNTLAIYISNLSNASTTTPPTLSGFTFLTGAANVGLFNGSIETAWIGTKLAVGGETTLTPTAGAGTIAGMTIIEIAGLGLSPILGTPVLQNNLTGTGDNSGSFSSTNTASIILFNTASQSPMGTITFDAALTAYTNTGTDVQGAYSIPGALVTSKTYSNTLGTGRVHANATIEIQPTLVQNPQTFNNYQFAKDNVGGVDTGILGFTEKIK